MCIDDEIFYMKKTNITFNSNSNASDEGIAINVEHSIMNIEGDLFFINNSAERETVCIQTSTLIIRNNAILEFINNSVKKQTGGMIICETTINIEDNASMIFTNNTGSKNGALFVLYSTLYVRNNASLTFTRNSVRTETGGALAAIFSNIYFEDNACSIFINNSAVDVGGALFLYSSRFIVVNLTSMAILQFIGNSAKSGGAIVLLSSSLEVVGGNLNMTFANNSAKEKWRSNFCTARSIVLYSTVSAIK